MPKRKKFQKLPSGYGSIRYLGKRRSLPYAVHPPCTDRDELGRYVRPAAICYVPDWYTGLGVLTAYHAGTYTPGMEWTIYKEAGQAAENDLDQFCQRLLRDHAVMTGQPAPEHKPTFSEVYDQFYEWKFGENAPKKLSAQSAYAVKAGYKNLGQLHDAPMEEITLNDLQGIVDSCPLKKASKMHMVNLIRQLYNFAMPRHLAPEDIGRYVVLPAGKENTHGVPFTDEDLKIFWKHKEDPVIEMVLIMCYSGFRISAFKAMKTDLKDGFFQGGVKTRSGKDRIVPIHSAIHPLVQARLARYGGKYFQGSVDIFRKDFRARLDALGISCEEPHTPHDCRHTFTRLCQQYKVPDADAKRLVGHSFGSDITHAVYGHWSLEDLRASIELIKVPE